MNLARWLQLTTWTRMEKWISMSSKWWWLPTSSKMKAQTTTKSGTTETHTIHAHICKLGCYFNEIRMNFLQFCQINIKIGLMSNSSSEKLTLKQSDMIPTRPAQFFLEQCLILHRGPWAKMWVLTNLYQIRTSFDHISSAAKYCAFCCNRPKNSNFRSPRDVVKWRPN